MAGGQERILRGRIRSVQATKKITRAMELIAASRIVKAQQRVIAAVPYSDRITKVVRDLSAAGAGSVVGKDIGRIFCMVFVLRYRLHFLQRASGDGHEARAKTLHAGIILIA